VNLDDPGSYRSVDPADALADVEGTADQWREARRLADVRLDLDGVDVVVVTGMGGSGIAGDVTAAVAAAAGFPLPILVHKGYGVPPFVGPRTLVVACSYSGNTEETLSAAEAALQRGARLFAVTSGGELAQRAESSGAPMVRIPGGGMPRHGLGYVAVPVLVALGLDADLDEAADVQDQVAAAASRQVPSRENPAKQLALRLASGSVPVAWGAQGIGRVAAYRLKCQLNENAKVPAFWAELPELDHNEIVGLQEPSPLAGNLGLVLFRDPVGEHARIATRFRVTEELVGSRFAWLAEVAARGESALARLASLLLLADLGSIYTALELGHDPTPIPSIDRLKQALAAS
jgi:glucose/mannose-6-phosphate isomerase